MSQQTEYERLKEREYEEAMDKLELDEYLAGLSAEEMEDYLRRLEEMAGY